MIKLYSGSVFKDFIVERLALGLPIHLIKSNFKAHYGIELTTEDIREITKNETETIKEKEEFFRQQMASVDVISKLTEIEEEVNEMRQMAKKSSNFKAYAQLTNTSLHSLDVLIKLVESFRKNSSETTQNIIQNNFFVFSALEKDGVIKIIDKNKLERLFVGEENNGDTTIEGTAFKKLV